MRKFVIIFSVTAVAAMLFLPGGTIPAPAATGGGVVSILKCKPGPVHQVDPIVAPGGVESMHLHQFFGGKAIQPVGTETTIAGMQAGGSTCPLTKDTAGYWIPVLYDASDRPVSPTQINVYYRSPKGKTVQAWPERFGLVCPGVGCATGLSQNDVGWGCTDSDSHATIAEALPCPAKLIAHVQLKDDSGKFPKVSLHVRYKVTSGFGYHLSSDMVEEGTPGGSTLHGDFWNTWDQATLARIIATLNAGKSCKGMTDASAGCLLAA